MFISAVLDRLVRKNQHSQDTQITLINAGMIEGSWKIPFP